MNRFFNLFSFKSHSNGERIELIDFLRGGAMLLVLLHHSNIPKGNYILAFHMPLFFIISGYVEYIQGIFKKDFVTYIKNRFFRLMIPYFLFEFLNILIWFAYSKYSNIDFSIKESLISVFLCLNTDYLGMYGRLWFLPCMFVSDIYAKIAMNYCQNKNLHLLTSIFIFFGISFCITTFYPGRLPMTIDTAFMGTAFILIGHFTGNFIKDMIEDTSFAIKILLSVILFLCEIYTIKFGNVTMLMFINRYGDYVFTICAAIFGSFSYLCIMSVIYTAFQKLSITKNLVCWYGCNSLATFPVHLTILFVCKSLWHLEWYWLFLITLALNVPAVNFITQYTPFMLGKK